MRKRSKRKMMIIIAIAIVLILLVLAFLVKKWLERGTFDGDGMVNMAAIDSITYNSGQDEYGRAESYDLKNARLNYCRAGGTVEESSAEVYEADSDLEQSVENVMTKYGVRDWTDLPESDIQIEDGPMAEMTISFADGTVVKLGAYYEMPENGWKAVSEITDLFDTYREEHQAVTESTAS